MTPQGAGPGHLGSRNLSIFEDRRQYPRYPARNLLADVGGGIFEVETISLTAAWIRGRPELAEPRCHLTFLPDEADGLPPVLEIMAHMVRQDGSGSVFRFDRVSMPLMRLVLRQASRQLGVEPYLVK